jgi:hypothetical protein
VQWVTVSHSVRGDGVTSVTFDVILPPGRSAVCSVRARNLDFAEVGRVDQEAGPFRSGSGRVTVDVRTTERAINGDVTGCVLR